MQSTALARALAQHRAAQRPPPLATIETPAAPAKPNPLLIAIARHACLEPRTLMEMARDRDGIRRPWY